METALRLKQTELRCAEQIPSLAVWVIEYAWSHRMMDVLEGLVPCKWQEGELRSLTLEEPCALRAAAAQAWSVVNARDVEHFESVLELLEVIYTLVPRLVTSIKHMKIMFGLKTMVDCYEDVTEEPWGSTNHDKDNPLLLKRNIFVPWLWNCYDMNADQVLCLSNRQQLDRGVNSQGLKVHVLPCVSSTQELSQLQSKRELDLMRKSHYEFKQLAQTLLYHKEMCQAYIRDQMEEQYGERYAQKLEERLFDYLQLLEKDLPTTTCIDQVLRQERPLMEGEQLLLGVLSSGPHCVPAVLKRLLYYAKAMPCTSLGMSQPAACTGKEKKTPQPPPEPKDRTKRTPPPAGKAGGVRSSMYPSSGKGCGEEKATSAPLCSQWYDVGEQSDGAAQRLRKQDLSMGGWSHGTRGHSLGEMELGQDERRWDQKEKWQGQEEGMCGPGKERQSWGRTKLAAKHCQTGDYPLKICSRHQRWASNLLQECSVDLGGQSMSILKEYPKDVGSQNADIGEQCKNEVEGQSVNILEQYPKQVRCQTVNIMKQYPTEVEGQTVNIMEECPTEVDGQTVNIMEQCPTEVEGQTLNIMEQCPAEVEGQTVNIMEQCPTELESQTMNIMEHCPTEVEGQTLNIMEQCPAGVESQTVIIMEHCPTEVDGQTVNIMEQCPMEIEGPTVSILEQCPVEVGCQTVSILELFSQKLEYQNGSILEKCHKGFGDQSVSILERCSQEMVGQTGRGLEEYSEVVRRNQGVIELQQIPRLASPQPVTRPHQYCTPGSYQRWCQDPASSLARMERVDTGVRISLESQLFLIRSQMLQPTVRVRRLTQRECRQATGARGSKIRPETEEEGREDDEDEKEESNVRKDVGEVRESDGWESDFSYSELGKGSDSDSDFYPS